ncbi:transposable element Tc3 transposase [Trichonephila clavipes]|nr:transposable element Tc3 transposase [Trichonephila clavipes]
MPIEHPYERKNRWNAGIFTITNRSVSNSECGLKSSVCDVKTMADISKNGRCYLTTSIMSNKSHNPSPRPISGNKCATSEGQYFQNTEFGTHSRYRNTHFETNCLQETQSCWHRERGARFESRNITERHHFPSRGVMICAGIMMDGRTDLYFFDTGSVTAHRYIDEVLEPYVQLFRGAVGPDFIFRDDNAPCHRAVLIDDFLETENIQRMPWPANSPYLNLIEHVRDVLGRQIVAISHPPSTVTELKRALQEA